MKKIITALLATAAVTAISNTAQADVAIRGGKPFFVDLGISLLARKSVTGLAVRRTVITMVADANVAAECESPGGTTSKPVIADPISVAGIQVIPTRLVSASGEAKMRIVTQAPDTDIPGAPDCPNTNWTETITGLAFSSATITISQQNKGVVLTTTCTIAPPSANGLIPGGNVACK